MAHFEPLSWRIYKTMLAAEFLRPCPRDSLHHRRLCLGNWGDGCHGMKAYRRRRTLCTSMFPSSESFSVYRRSRISWLNTSMVGSLIWYSNRHETERILYVAEERGRERALRGLHFEITVFCGAHRPGARRANKKFSIEIRYGVPCVKSLSSLVSGMIKLGNWAKYLIAYINKQIIIY